MSDEELLVMAYADPETSRRIQDIADLAASYHDMTTGQQEAFDQMVRAACRSARLMIHMMSPCNERSSARAHSVSCA
jgi:hypothetical protein